VWPVGFLDGKQSPLDSLPPGRGVGLKIGSIGDFSIAYFVTPRPLAQQVASAARTTVTISRSACYEVQVRPNSSCAYDALALKWRVPADTVSAIDRIGIFAAKDREPAVPLRWINTSGVAEGERKIRIGQAGLFEARYFVGEGTVADMVYPFTIVVGDQCGEYVVEALPSSSTGSMVSPDTAEYMARNATASTPTVLILSSVTALSATHAVRVPHANLGGGDLSQTTGIAVMLWILLLEDATGSYRSILYKGTGNKHRTPSLWFLPKTRQLTFQLSTTRTHEDFGVSKQELPLCSWTHIAYAVSGRTATLCVCPRSNLPCHHPLRTNGTTLIMA
jgi:hypothetical protein